jgi:hypothetical protein
MQTQPDSGAQQSYGPVVFKHKVAFPHDKDLRQHPYITRVCDPNVGRYRMSTADSRHSLRGAVGRSQTATSTDARSPQAFGYITMKRRVEDGTANGQKNPKKKRQRTGPMMMKTKHVYHSTIQGAQFFF